MSKNTLTLVQEVYFDLCDLLDNNELDDRVNGFYEFDSIRDFIMEQKQKMALIERDLDLNHLDVSKYESKAGDEDSFSNLN